MALHPDFPESPHAIYDFVYVDQGGFEKFKPVSFRQLIDGFQEYKQMS